MGLERTVIRCRSVDMAAEKRRQRLRAPLLRDFHRLNTGLLKDQQGSHMNGDSTAVVPPPQFPGILSCVVQHVIQRFPRRIPLTNKPILYIMQLAMGTIIFGSYVIFEF